MTSAKLDQASIPLSGFAVANANVALGNNKLTGVKDPTSAQDAATKKYVDAVSPLTSFGYHPEEGVGSGEAFVKMASVGGVDYGLFYETSFRSKEYWGSASNTCLMVGKRLPDYHEWRMACDGRTNGTATTIHASFGNWEWASSRPSAMLGTDGVVGAGSVVAGGGSCDTVDMYWVRSFGASDGTEDSMRFRCVR